MGATVTTTPPASFWSPKGRNTSLIVGMIVWALLVAFLLIWIVSALLVNGEYICLDRQPVWGPPEDPEVYTSCSGHIDELLRKWGWDS
jgi:hypothetical protein